MQVSPRYAGLQMSNPEHREIIEKGVSVWNQWRATNPRVQPDLTGAVLSDTKPSKGQPRAPQASFVSIDLSHALIHGTVLRGADLRNSNLSEAKLDGADLRRANLAGSDFREALLAHANLTLADFSRVDLTGAVFWETILARVDFTGAIGLNSCRHGGPSIIDHRTLQSFDELPEAFLRGIGLPDTLITFLPSMLRHAIEFYSCFLSYSTKDQDFADRLHADLQARGVRCWFAPHDIRAGKKLHEQIDEAIRVYDRLLLILSEHSMNSEWVKTEIAHARQKELSEKRQVLFPISVVPFAEIREWNCFDADTGKDSAREIREYFIPDFSNWKNHDSYHQAFQRLVRDLKAKEKASAISDGG